jgi:ferredoxin
MLTSSSLKEYAKECGADLVGIGTMDRFEGAPQEMDPRYIFPDAKAIIGLAFRVPRGYFRGIEEGTQFFQYPAMGYAGINETYAPIVLREVCCFLEDNGYEGVAYRNTGGRGPVSDMTGAGPSESPELGRRLQYFEPVSPDKPAPDVQIHFRIAAYLCGLGEIGYSKMFLTPEYGPRQRFAFILTDAPLDPDPIYDGPPLCDRCKSCVKECPGHAISDNEQIQVTLAGRKVEWGKLDEWGCFYAYMGGVKSINPFLPRDAYKDIPDGDAIMRGEKKMSEKEVLRIQGIVRNYYPNICDYNNAMCGGKGCIRACMVHLEKQNKLTNKFSQPFRKRKPWRLPD